jgi:excisionase family DNA binding protein
MKSLDVRDTEKGWRSYQASVPTRPALGLVDHIRGKPRALTVRELAAVLNVSERQIYKLAAEHRIPGFKIGGSLRFDPVAIALWLREKMASADVRNRMKANEGLRAGGLHLCLPSIDRCLKFEGRGQ